MTVSTKSTLAFRALAAVGAASLVLGALAAPAAARDPAYAAAKSSGQVGEKMDGYIGIVGSGSPELRRLVDDINIKRKAVYAEKAKAQHATVEEYAFTSGCLLIAQTSPGEKYQAPDGSWKTRGSGAPERDPRCP
ncbi:hypothetical protein GCM10011371_01410 [Novosphingobium marinum]|uniref:DUF1318 domain-containing protein n=1 Tax=Novosphingobium marinum TaxID=1514948 RepID=A0A7Y9XV59_9SPHN|nr:YdbL family protein [Novosphingobium marinum]NYH93833.1 hypothetical protein [Novosphingobium marinum]GGC17617.1 hypothetical protein GCM10011371_01410 [Novosphingobium marinum]